MSEIQTDPIARELESRAQAFMVEQLLANADVTLEQSPAAQPARTPYNDGPLHDSGHRFMHPRVTALRRSDFGVNSHDSI
ncbi:MAG TPA: hypothetical protein VF401_02110, partial [Candidatus Saccharimonadales bacterium]